MRVLIITNSQFPHGMAPVKRRICYAKALISQGVDCKILIFSHTEKKNVPTLNTQSKGVFEGVPFEYLGGSNVSSSIKIVANLQSIFLGLYLVLFLLMKLQHGDIVFSYAKDSLTSYMNLVIAVTHLKRAKYVRELCELPFGKGKETRSAIRSRKNILKNQFPKYDGVVAISESLAVLARKHMRNDAKILKVPILVEYDKYAMEDCSNEEYPYIFHSGTLTEQKDGLIGMFKAFTVAAENLNSNVKFICTGNKESSPCKDEIDELIDKYNLRDRILFTGFLRDDDLKRYLQGASIVIINKYKNRQNDYCFSTKLGEYMAAGKAIIMTRIGEALNWVHDGEDVIIVNPMDTQQLSTTIVQLFQNRSLRLKLGNAAKVTCKSSFDCYSWGDKLKFFFLNL